MSLPLLASAAAPAPSSWTLYADPSIAPVAFAASEIRAACPAGLVELPLHRMTAPAAAPTIAIAASAADSTRLAAALGLPPAPAGVRKPQSYSIRRRGATLAVLAADPVGAMYGGLDLAEALRLETWRELADRDHAPRIENRGLKFNIPLDARTPSYSDNSDAAQQNIPEMWSFDFWRDLLDQMARCRFNTLSLWNLHPFPSLVRVPEFPDVALAEVMRTRVPMDDTYSHSGSDMVRPELLTRLETVRTLSIEDKIRFWRDVMQYARDRGVDVYWFTWNLFTFGAEGKYGITPEQTNPRTIAYFRASVREMVLTYPLLAGFGVTAGERMPVTSGEFGREKWLWKTYGEGVADAVRRQPGRKVRMIHRYHMTGHDEIVREWRDYPGPLDLSFKYSIAHMYSSPRPPFLAPALSHLSPSLRTWLTVRDDDFYSFRWGDPDYAREYLRNIPGPDKVAGFYMGPDGYIWGREFLSTEPETPRQLVTAKRWYGFLIWGRLAYDPDLPDALFRRTLAARFPQAPAEKLQRAWAEASRVFPAITRFFWGDIDLRWLPEACLSHPRYRGFYTVADFIRGQTMPGSGLLNIVEWRARKVAGTAAGAPGPLEVATELTAHATAALKALPELRARQGENKELRLTLGDIEALAHIGNYYAAKIRGAAELALFDKTARVEHRDAAVRHLQEALDHWKRYAAAYTLQYQQPRLYNRVGWVDIPALADKAEQDIAIARLWTPGAIADAPPPRHADVPFRK